MTTETYSLRLLFTLKDVQPTVIHGFPTYNTAHMAGMFLQLAHDRIMTFEVAENRVIHADFKKGADPRDLYKEIDVIDEGMAQLGKKVADDDGRELHGLILGSWTTVKPAIREFILARTVRSSK